MNKPELPPIPPPPEVKPNEKTGLAQLASKGCHRCSGRGYTAYNRSTDKYTACPCVRKRLVSAATALSKDSLAAANARYAAGNRARQRMTHFERLGEEIRRIRLVLEPLISELGILTEPSDDEEQLNLEMDTRAAELTKAKAAARAYLLRSEMLHEESAGFLDVAESLKRQSRQLAHEAREAYEEFAQREDRANDAIKALDREAKERSRELISDRARRQHKLQKKIREHEKRLEKLVARAGRVKDEITQDVALATTGNNGESGSDNSER